MPRWSTESRRVFTPVQMYLETKDAGLVCRQCGISRPTLRLWVRRFEKDGLDGLKSHSQRPQHSPNEKVTSKEEAWVIELRHRRLGSRRIQSQLLRLHDGSLARGTIQKILSRHQSPPLKKSRRPRKTVKR